MARADAGQCCDEIEHGFVAHSVIDELAAATGLDQSRTAHLLQVLRRIGNRDADAICQGLHAALALRQSFQQLQAMLVRDRLCDRGELSEQLAFGARA